MASKQITDRYKSSQSVQAALRTNRDRILAGIRKDFGDAAADGSAKLIDGLLAKLQADSKAMVDADNAHAIELGGGLGVRTERDEQAAKVRHVLVDVRELVGTFYGPIGTETLGFHGDTPQDPAAIFRLAQIVLDRLANWTPPRSHFSRVSFDANDWLAHLRGPVAGLEKAIANVAKEERETDATLTARNQATATYDHTFSLAANLVSDLLITAGEKALASRLRPSTRRPGQTVEGAQEDAPAAPAPQPLPA